MSPDKSRKPTIPDSEVQAILRRAIQIDAQLAERVSEHTVREVARDLGVSDKAVEQALSEHRHAALNVSNRARTVLTPVWLGAAAVGVGAVARAMRPLFDNGVHWESLVSSLVVVGVVSVIAFRPARRDAQRTYQGLSAAAWAGYTVGWSLVHGNLWGDLLGMTFCFALASSVIGGVITRLRSTHSDSDSDEFGASAEAVRRRPWSLRKILRRLLDSSSTNPSLCHTLS